MIAGGVSANQALPQRPGKDARRNEGAGVLRPPALLHRQWRDDRLRRLPAPARRPA
ncbi:hypothetical protein ACPA9J_35490 [Pseudomonas aeruginosa]